MSILVGCSGWSYDDWVGMFYPIEMARRKGDFLAYYARFFHTVEINSSFYRPPGEQQVLSWIKKGKSFASFEYSLKMPELVTHKSMVSGDAGQALRWAQSFERCTVLPLADAGLLGCVLLQLSPYFPNNSANIKTLESVLDGLSCNEHEYAVEFRHRSWLEEGGNGVAGAALQILEERNVANVLVDGPGQPAATLSGSDHAYIRFHGRNYDIWYQDKKENDFRLDRYDYLYTREQLLPWLARIKDADLKAEKVRIYFNNHARSKAVKNALQLMDMLLIEHEYKEICLQNQFTLGGF
ncbi:Uncharacterised protein [uncultured archaeon]|nr:Uncharacterised protein [uncultured archaeon]